MSLFGQEFLKYSWPLWFGGVYRIQSLMANSLKVMWPLGVQSQNIKMSFLYISALGIGSGNEH